MEQLIIIGNGFDLHCGLKSSYKDYCDYKYTDEYKKLIDQLNKDRKAYQLTDGRGEAITIWDLIFSKKIADQNWVDVEEEIKKFIHNIVLYNYINEIFIRGLHWGYNSKNEPDYKLSNRIYKIIKTDYQTSIKNAGLEWKDWLAILLEELKKFEQSFCEYLKNQVVHSDSYCRMDAPALKSIVEANLSKEDSQEPISIISFNYTIPPESYNNKKLVKKYKNVHGNLADKNIIFGIDGHNLEDRDLIKFTKTYRTLAFLKDEKDEEQAEKLWTNNLGIIKFYGHSLGQADYSYFQAIFDSIDLYNSNVKLALYYHGDQYAMFDQVTKLMKAYGSTLDNKDHGRNLLHKLILENRILITEDTIIR